MPRSSCLSLDRRLEASHGIKYVHSASLLYAKERQIRDNPLLHGFPGVADRDLSGRHDTDLLCSVATCRLLSFFTVCLFQKVEEPLRLATTRPTTNSLIKIAPWFDLHETIGCVDAAASRTTPHARQAKNDRHTTTDAPDVYVTRLVPPPHVQPGAHARTAQSASRRLIGRARPGGTAPPAQGQSPGP